MMDLSILDTINLKPGRHDSGDEMCAMEAAAYIAGEPLSDHPQCVCPVIASFIRSWNDGLPNDETRTRLLIPLVKLVIGSRSTPEIENRRTWMILDWLIRTSTPMSLDLVVSLQPHAAQLRALPEITDDTVSEANSRVDAAWAAAWASARDAARDAAWAAAGAAAGVARDAARDALAGVARKSQESASDLVRRLVDIE